MTPQPSAVRVPRRSSAAKPLTAAAAATSNWACRIAARNSVSSDHTTPPAAAGVTQFTAGSTGSTATCTSSNSNDPAPVKGVAGLAAKLDVGRSSSTMFAPGDSDSTKYQLFPTPQQWDKVLQAFGVASWTYNRCVQAANDGLVVASRQALSEFVVNDDAALLQDNGWVKDIPLDFRAGALHDFLDARDEIESRLGNGAMVTNKMKFRSRKQPTRSIHIARLQYSKGVFYPQYFSSEPFVSSEPLPDQLPCDSMLQLTRRDELYLVAPQQELPRAA